jgi:hypothetical protein
LTNVLEKHALLQEGYFQFAVIILELSSHCFLSEACEKAVEAFEVDGFDNQKEDFT